MLQRQGRLGFYMTSTRRGGDHHRRRLVPELDDPIFLSYRELGSLLWRGVPLALILNQLHRQRQDLCLGPPDAGALLLPRVGHPVGDRARWARSFRTPAASPTPRKLRGTGQVALAFLRRGHRLAGRLPHRAQLRGRVHGARRLRDPQQRLRDLDARIGADRGREPGGARAEGYGVPGCRIDGNDFLAVVHAVGERGRARARAARARR